jgi:hypothetical protein
MMLYCAWDGAAHAGTEEKPCLLCSAVGAAVFKWHNVNLAVQLVSALACVLILMLLLLLLTCCC